MRRTCNSSSAGGARPHRLDGAPVRAMTLASELLEHRECTEHALLGGCRWHMDLDRIVFHEEGDHGGSIEADARQVDGVVQIPDDRHDGEGNLLREEPRGDIC